MAKSTTVYLNRQNGVSGLRFFTGAVAHAAMWNTITNVLRTMSDFIYLCLATSDGEYLVTADDELIIIEE